jgi:hypothetical protein
MTNEPTPARRYVNAIRNDAKRDYARAYLLWLQCGRQDAEPTRPEGLSFMGAQAVRHRLADLQVV